MIAVKRSFVNLRLVPRVEKKGRRDRRGAETAERTLSYATNNYTVDSSAARGGQRCQFIRHVQHS